MVCSLCTLYTISFGLSKSCSLDLLTSISKAFGLRKSDLVYSRPQMMAEVAKSLPEVTPQISMLTRIICIPLKLLAQRNVMSSPTTIMPCLVRATEVYTSFAHPLFRPGCWSLRGLLPRLTDYYCLSSTLKSSLTTGMHSSHKHDTM